LARGFSDRDSALKDVESLRNSKQHSKNAPALIGYSDINNPSFMPSGDFQSISYWVQSSKGSEDLYIAKDFNLEIELAEESFTIL